MASVEADFYELLEVERTADDKTIKSSYRKPGDEISPGQEPRLRGFEARFKAISEAYDCLKDPQKRAAYDRYGKAAFQGGGGGGQDFGGFSDIFENIFGEFMGRGQGRQNQTTRGADLRHDIEISLDEAFHGKQAEIEIEVSAGLRALRRQRRQARHRRAPLQDLRRPRQGPRAAGLLHGRAHLPDLPRPRRSDREALRRLRRRGPGRPDRERWRLRVPPGVDEGTRIRLSGEGEAGIRGGPPGDLYVFVHVKRHSLFERDGTTLFARAPISFTTAALGGTIEVPGVDKQVHEIRIPSGIQSGKQIRLRGAGMPVLNGRGHGDLVIEIAVETPTRLSGRQKELLEEFRATETGEECPQFERLLRAAQGSLERPDRLGADGAEKAPSPFLVNYAGCQVPRRRWPRACP